MDARFDFQQFSIQQEGSPFKVGTDGVLLGAWADFKGAGTILDLGSGTGLIALMAAQRNQSANIIGIEPSTKAFANLEQNFKNAPWSDRLVAMNVSWQEYLLQNTQQVDHIVCNPPFFDSGQQKLDQDAAMARHVKDLDFKSICEGAAKLLSVEGKISMVFPMDSLENMIETLTIAGLYVNRICRVKSRPQKASHRVMLEAGKKQNWKPINSELTLLESTAYEQQRI